MKKAESGIERRLVRGMSRGAGKKYVLKLYVAGLSTRSQKAIENIRMLCDKYLQGRCELEILDIYQDPIIAKNGQILAAPTLIKELPLPLRKFVGDMSNVDKLLVGLNLIIAQR